MSLSPYSAVQVLIELSTLHRMFIFQHRMSGSISLIIGNGLNIAYYTVIEQLLDCYHNL